MAGSIRESVGDHVGDQPPPYTESIPLHDRRKPPSIIEPLPSYASTSPLSELQRKSHFKRYRLLIFCLTIVVIAIIAGIIGGITHKHTATEHTINVYNENIRTLAATDCAAASLVMYQDRNVDLWIAGRLKNGNWNGTSSSTIPSIKVDMSSFYFRPMEGSNITMVCYTQASSSTITIKFYYLTMTSPYTISEGTMTIPNPNPMPNNFTIFANAISARTGQLQNITGASSLAVTVYPSTGPSTSEPEIRLYYAEPIDETNSLTHANLYELIWAQGTGWSQPRLLNSTSQSCWSPMAVTTWKSTSTGALDVHLFFVDNQGDLAGSVWRGAGLGWSNETTISSNTSTSSFQPGAQLAACISSQNQSQGIFLLTLVSSQPVIALASPSTRVAPSGINVEYWAIGNTSSSPTFPDALMDPFLIACSSPPIDGLASSSSATGGFSANSTISTNSTLDSGGSTTVNGSDGSPMLYYVVKTGPFAGKLIANQTWDDVEQVWYPGYPVLINGVNSTTGSFINP